MLCSQLYTPPNWTPAQSQHCSVQLFYWIRWLSALVFHWMKPSTHMVRQIWFPKQTYFLLHCTQQRQPCSTLTSWPFSLIFYTWIATTYILLYSSRLLIAFLFPNVRTAFVFISKASVFVLLLHKKMSCMRMSPKNGAKNYFQPEQEWEWMQLKESGHIP